jgi:hypothetical protein
MDHCAQDGSRYSSAPGHLSPDEACRRYMLSIWGVHRMGANYLSQRHPRFAGNALQVYRDG